MSPLSAIEVVGAKTTNDVESTLESEVELVVEEGGVERFVPLAATAFNVEASS